eukprot:11134154-Lingulodinium_polyedra.AAC.1
MRSARRCGCGRSIRAHLCATFEKRYTKTRSNRPSAAATARKPHASALHAHTSFLARVWSAQAC